MKRRGEGFDVYVYFNNDPDAVAVQNAATLLQLAEYPALLSSQDNDDHSFSAS